MSDIDQISPVAKRDIEQIQLHEFQQPINCCNITAVAYAISVLGHKTTVDDIFYVTRLPIASVLDDGMTLAETYDTCLKFVQKEQLGFSVKLEHFDQNDMSLEKFIAELETAVCNEDDVHILNFNVSIAHNNNNLQGGHFSLLADYDSKTQEITIADTNPKKYARFWTCPAQRMYQACTDKDSSSTRSRGMIVVCR